MRRGLWMIFRWPVVLAVVSLFGLLSALIGDGVFDVLSWLGLGVPLGLLGVVWLRLRRANRLNLIREIEGK
ncbi:hypothetical protein H7698_14815 [Pseudomonas sp. p50]|uniref:hypothetical protein n=1 Tax=Pseudomonas sp. p50(2008) TaxID=2816832 RepID=UPI00188CD2EE|nr:hypothetical protein [Pseudomonas sp. p50(2008)]MBF4557348.1 hypothetical protein [Pseudomonas sp. p50(2008)]